MKVGDVVRIDKGDYKGLWAEVVAPVGWKIEEYERCLKLLSGHSKGAFLFQPEDYLSFGQSGAYPIGDLVRYTGSGTHSHHIAVVRDSHSPVDESIASSATVQVTGATWGGDWSDYGVRFEVLTKTEHRGEYLNLVPHEHELILSITKAGLIYLEENEERFDRFRMYDALILQELLLDWTENQSWVYWPSAAEIGGLSEAPVICDDATLEDNGEWKLYGRVWWHGRYALDDAIRELKERGYVSFDLAPNESDVPTSESQEKAE